MNVNNLNNFLEKGLNVVDNNKVLNSVVGLFLVLYGGFAAPKLPQSIAKLFDYTLVKLIALFLIAYLASKDKSVALIAVVALVVTFQTLTKYKIMDKIKNFVMPKKVDLDSPVPVPVDHTDDKLHKISDTSNDTPVEIENVPVVDAEVEGYSGGELAELN